jgi:hypothetical protein
MPKYHVTISLSGKAMLEVVAPSSEAARHAAIQLSLADLALTGKADVLNFRVVPGEIKKITTSDDDTDDEDDQPNKPRPSGWYRPRFE